MQYSDYSLWISTPVGYRLSQKKALFAKDDFFFGGCLFFEVSGDILRL